MTIPKVELGQKVRDKITGLTGIAVTRIEYLNGCVQIGVKPKMDPKKPTEMPDGVFIDIEQIEVIGTKKKKTLKTNTGGYNRETPAI